MRIVSDVMAMHLMCVRCQVTFDNVLVEGPLCLPVFFNDTFLGDIFRRPLPTLHVVC